MFDFGQVTCFSFQFISINNYWHLSRMLLWIKKLEKNKIIAFKKSAVDKCSETRLSNVCGGTQAVTGLQESQILCAVCPGTWGSGGGWLGEAVQRPWPPVPLSVHHDIRMNEEHCYEVWAFFLTERSECILAGEGLGLRRHPPPLPKNLKPVDQWESRWTFQPEERTIQQH